jgi:dolichol kinase
MVFILLDLIRLSHHKTNEYLTVKVTTFYKKGEEHKFSTITTFLVAAFISVVLFDENIAITAIVFLIFGDMFGKIFGLAFGRHPIPHTHKTYEGLLANYGSVLIFGFILYTSISIPLLILVIGGFVAPIIEVMSSTIDDNLTVPLISGVCMTIVKMYM